MVSSSLKMDLQDLLDTLERLRREFGATREYQAWRKKLPDDWPV